MSPFEINAASMTRDRDRRGTAECLGRPGDRADRNALTGLAFVGYCSSPLLLHHVPLLIPQRLPFHGLSAPRTVCNTRATVRSNCCDGSERRAAASRISTLTRQPALTKIT